MAVIWTKTKFLGVRYRQHATRKHGVGHDRCYSIRYKLDGRDKEETVGWASEGVTPESAFKILSTIRDNIRQGIEPMSIKAMRELNQEQEAARRRTRAAEERRNVSFKQFFDDVFLPDASTRWKPETTRKAVEHVANWIDPVTSDTPLRETDLTHVNRIKAKLSSAGRSARTQQYVFRTFAMVWATALDHGLVTGPCPTRSQSFRLPKIDNERQRYLSREDEERLLAEVLKRSKQAHDMAVVSIDSGLRFGEVAGLTWECVDIPHAVLHVLDTKGGRDRIVPMTARLVELFATIEKTKQTSLVFPNQRDEVHKQIPSAFKRGLVSASLNEGITNPKLKASFHTLRHTYASRLVQSGVDLYKVQRILGHSTPVMTARYSKLADDDLRQAVAAMERDSQIKASAGKVIDIRQRKAAASEE